VYGHAGAVQADAVQVPTGPGDVFRIGIDGVDLQFCARCQLCGEAAVAAAEIDTVSLAEPAFANDLFGGFGNDVGAVAFTAAAVWQIGCPRGAFVEAIDRPLVGAREEPAVGRGKAEGGSVNFSGPGRPF
jgi:hypothetical protein